MGNFWDQTKANEWKVAPADGYAGLMVKSGTTWRWAVCGEDVAQSGIAGDAETAFKQADEALAAVMRHNFNKALRTIAALTPLVTA